MLLPAEIDVPCKEFLGFMADPNISGLARFGLRQSVDGEELCLTCGKGGDGRMLHRLKHEGAFSQLCSSCILFYNRCMHCSICYQVYADPSELGDPALWVTCCKCLRLSHLHCFDKEFSSSSMSSSVCTHCSLSSALTESSSEADTADTSSIKSQRTDVSMEASNFPSCKKLRTSKEVLLDSNKHGPLNIPFFDQEALAAAKLVSILAVKEAAVAKAKAFALADVAAKAAARAKAALDIAYHAGKDEAKFKAKVVRQTVSGTGHHSMHSEGGSIQEDSEEGRKYEKVDMRMVRNDHGGQVTRTFAPIQKNEASVIMPSVDTSFVSKEETTGMPFDSSEATIQDYLFSMHDIDDQSHEELGLEVISLASSEGLLTGSSRLDVTQDPPHLSTHHSCSSGPEEDFTVCVSQGFVEINCEQETGDLVHEMPSCLEALSTHYNSQEMEGGALVSGQTGAADLEGREILLPGVNLTNIELLQYRVAQNENKLNTGIFSSDVSSAIDSGSAEVNGNSIATASQFSNSEQDLCPDIPLQASSFSLNLVTGLEEFNGSELIANDQIRHEANISSVADSTLNWANQEAECALMGSGTDQAAKFIMSNVSNTPVGVSCPMSVMTPALSGVLAGWHS